MTSESILNRSARSAGPAQPAAALGAGRQRSSIAISILALGLAAQPAVLAQSSGGDFAITRHTIDSGGARAAGGDFTVVGTLGQPEAGTPSALGGDFQLSGGFWANGFALPAGELLFSDGFEG